MVAFEFCFARRARILCCQDVLAGLSARLKLDGQLMSRTHNLALHKRMKRQHDASIRSLPERAPISECVMGFEGSASVRRRNLFIIEEDGFTSLPHARTKRSDHYARVVARKLTLVHDL